jgi:HSP20 family protein
MTFLSQAFGMLDSLFAELERDLSRSFYAPMPASFRLGPAMDITERDDAVVVTVDVPGLDADDIHIELDDGRLTVRGTREMSSGDGYHRAERAVGSFARSVHLPAAVDEDKVTATLDRGVLEIVVPKRAESKARRIPITDAKELSKGAETSD